MLRNARRLACLAVPRGTRGLNVHEYQGAQLLAKHGVNVPVGIACTTPEAVAAAALKLGGPGGEVVVKSQVLAGGRGLGTFKNGFKGGVHIVKAGQGPAGTEEAPHGEDSSNQLFGPSLCADRRCRRDC